MEISKIILKEAVNKSTSYREVLLTLGYGTGGGSHKYLKDKIKEYNISTAHFVNKRHVGGRLSDGQYFVNGCKRNGTHLKARLIKDGHLEEKCDECGLGPEWNEKFLPLQVDHKDGNNINNELSNLRLVCPNCHSQTDNWGGKQFKNTKYCKCGVRIDRYGKNSLCYKCSMLSR